jgi:cytochrome c oxidase accessory protein FixG
MEAEQINNQQKHAQTYFRDKLPTVGEDGKRRWIFPKKPNGKFFRQRWIVAIILLSFLFAAPFIQYKGEPFMLFNVLERKFIIFGQVFWPQDFHLVVLSFIALIVFIILFTVIYGRIFCGWACPQTIFMEFVFRQIEYLIEGDFHMQKKLARQKWNFEKVWKKSLKHLIFFGIAFIISNVFLAYIVGSERLWLLISNGPLAHFGTFAAIVIFSGVFYFIFAFFREQVCIIVCPYGRLQGVLLDEKSIVVAYDYKRGEPRSNYNPLENRSATTKGDCIDCLSCVTVCPTGIDIRNGTQLECINCTACIDACNSIMDRVRLPRGLIRYDSEKGISTGNKKIMNGRTIAYSAILGVLLIVISSLFIIRSDVEVTILRVPGSLFQEYGPENYSNIFKIQLVNKTRADMPIDMRLISHAGQIIFVGDNITAIDGKLTEATFLVILPKDQLHASNTPITIGIFTDDKLITTYNTSFIGPNNLDYN